MFRGINRTEMGIAKAGITAVAALVVFTAACGGGDEAAPTPTGAGGVATTQPASLPSGSVGAGIQDQTFTVGQHFWHSGFRVEIDDGEISSNENALSGKVTHFLTLRGTLENTGTDTGYFGPTVVVTTSRNSYVSRNSSALEDVPGGLQKQASWEFLIDEDFELAGAGLLVGDPDFNQASVPLAPTGDAIRLEPSEPAISGMLSMELIDLTFTSADLRYDLPTNHREVAAGKQALTLHFDATSRKGGNWNLFPADLILTLPDGNEVAPDGSEIGSLGGSDGGVTTTDRYVRFIVDDMPQGSYTLHMTPGSWFIGEDGVTEATFDFTIE